jgi:toxin ParE1/3/4
MAVPVILSDECINDLAVLVSYIARDNKDRARSFGNELIDRALGIGHFPEMGRQVPEIGAATVREIILSPYRIIYEIYDDPQRVFILRFWHSARGTPEIKRTQQ